jgi:hypothetical protein
MAIKNRNCFIEKSIVPEVLRMKAALQFIFNKKVVFMQNAIAVIDVFFRSNFNDTA